MKHRKYLSWLAIGLFALVSTDAMAQQDQELEGVDFVAEEVTVTGSRIRGEAAESTAPVVILAKTEIQEKGLASIGDVLQTLTVQSNAINTQANNGGDGSTRISLRGLGAGRTLVLVNGRRFVPGGTGANSSVDLNSIPASVIERIEVLKDGASAVYGSDAVGGVVNVITRSDLEGVEFEYYQGVAGAGDGDVIDASLTAGLRSGRGSILFSAGYHNRKPVWTGDRDFSKADKAYDWEANDGTFATNGSSATPQGTIIDRLGAEGNAAWQSIVERAGGDASVYYNAPSGGWRPMNFGGNSDDGSGDLYNYQPANYLYTPQTRYSAFLSGNYLFNDILTGFFEVSYTNRQSDQKLAPTPLFIFFEDDVSVSAENQYNEYGRDFLDVRRRFVEASNRNFLQDLDTYRIVLGMEHEFQGFIGDLAFSYGRTSGTNVNEGRFILSNVRRALGPDSECVAPCVPLDLLHGPGTITEDMLDYISYTGIARGYTTQRILQYNLTGDLYDLPAGPLAVAVGASSRWEAGGSIPDPITATGNTTGNKEEATEGDYSVRAVYAETSIPVYQNDMGGLNVTAAGRLFNYDTFGSDFTYEAGARLELPRGLAFRSTYSKAFRAPSIAEMFLGQSDSFPLVSDPCSVVDEAGNPRNLTSQQMRNCSSAGVPSDYEDTRAQLRARIGGSTDLEPERANTMTAGLVYQPEFIDNLDIAVSYYATKIEDEIGALGAGLILSNCYSQDSPSDCDKVQRDQNGVIRNIFSTATNIGETETNGLDIELNYIDDTPLGLLSARLESNYLFAYDVMLPVAGGFELVQGRGYYDLGVFPNWQHNANVGLKWGRASAGVNWQYTGGFQECEDDDCKGLYRDDVGTNPAVRDVDSHHLFGIQGSYRLFTGAGGSVITVGVNNVFDTPPAVIFNGFLGTSDASSYDFLGRYLYIRLSHFL
ncbi:MAG: TonB-dependent receptor plug domain-containing protein [Gemmatimonadetes bacterium]|nr:TonB-dependent receptor plug domain-containing protein [Gemmatimonadota bacterium]MYG15164.1 TonB-dependent receptor plug domain-containing protein [Gemmatimonadota bacterium]MYH20428.1 TonB-dependent receptor plug domain-containing protein [Gemmatimonadota bacterium]MYK99870.1 TonB-dependent receptor plug domain-containing protein [Gemmatimonadota bacterium]